MRSTLTADIYGYCGRHGPWSVRLFGGCAMCPRCVEQRERAWRYEPGAGELE